MHVERTIPVVEGREGGGYGCFTFLWMSLW